MAILKERVAASGLNIDDYSGFSFAWPGLVKKRGAFRPCTPDDQVETSRPDVPASAHNPAASRNVKAESQDWAAQMNPGSSRLRIVRRGADGVARNASEGSSAFDDDPGSSNLVDYDHSSGFYESSADFDEDGTFGHEEAVAGPSGYSDHRPDTNEEIATSSCLEPEDTPKEAIRRVRVKGPKRKRPRTLDELRADYSVLDVVEDGFVPGWSRVVQASLNYRGCVEKKVYIRSPDGVMSKYVYDEGRLSHFLRIFLCMRIGHEAVQFSNCWGGDGLFQST